MKTSGRAAIALFCGVVALVGLTNPPFSYGGEIIYTWHNNPDSVEIFVQLIVNDSTLSQGIITRADVDSFTFVTPGILIFYKSDVSTSTFPIPISTISGAPTCPTSGISAEVPIEGTPYSYTMGIDFNSNSFTSVAGVGAAEWELDVFGSHGVSGTGYWTVITPEPSSVILASLGFVCVSWFTVKWNFVRSA
jgi:hypothetical protein